jgi:hypothetical protein
LLISLFVGWAFLAFRIGVMDDRKGNVHRHNHAPAATSKQPGCKWQRQARQAL